MDSTDHGQDIGGASAGGPVARGGASPGRPPAPVTGARRGIGRAPADEFAGHGFDVVAGADEPAIHEVAAQLQSGAGTVIPVQTDLSAQAGVEQAWSAVTSTG